MPDLTPSTPDAAAARSWVWHATVESRSAGKVSVLACVETLVAVTLYWWIAIRWDTHWHLLTSVLIAPLLLLRSPESMELGVRWFLKNRFKVCNYDIWSKIKRERWLIIISAISGIIVFPLAFWLGELCLKGQTSWSLLVWSILVGSLSLALWVTFCVAIMATSLGTFGMATISAAGAVGLGGGVVAGAAIGATTAVAVNASGGLIAGIGSFVGAFVGAYAGQISTLYIGLGMGLGLAVRGLALRVMATLMHLPRGFVRLAGNWRENNFQVDSYLPAELVPGIREIDKEFSIDGFYRTMCSVRSQPVRWISMPLLAAFFFLPAFLYRLNIKATCWFWWPLAYLLKPTQKADKTSSQKQALCWPWDNPLQMLLILVPGVLVLGILIAEYCDFGLWKEFRNAAAVPIPLKVALGMGWGHIPPWHWALLIVEATGLGMLAIAGKARSHRASDNWEDYAQSGMQRDLWLMDKLSRLRSLATIFMLVLGLGMCLISFPEGRRHLPDSLLQRLEYFYFN